MAVNIFYFKLSLNTALDQLDNVWEGYRTDGILQVQENEKKKRHWTASRKAQV